MFIKIEIMTLESNMCRGVKLVLQNEYLKKIFSKSVMSDSAFTRP